MPPDQDHSRWSFDATTDERGIVRWAVRWYAPIESGTGVVVFDGHQKAISEFEFGFEDDAIFTCFDLDAANGIRWQLPISRVIDIKSHRVEKIRPVFSTYQRSDHLIMLVETGVHYRGFRELDEERILIKKIQLSDGRCETLADTSNGMLIDYIRWSSANSPQTTSQGGSLMFINQSVDLNVPIGMNASRLVTVFPHHSGEPEVVALRLQNLTTSSDLIGILPDGQVIVGNESSLWSCTRQSDGQMSVKLICKLLIPDAEP
ncbi:MAG: hypothetical protein JNL58_32230 [Planctomyces sp.]|nr:hypothetical protein [Planctomyces sp.]